MANSQQAFGIAREHCVIDNGASFGVLGPGSVAGAAGYDDSVPGKALGATGASDQGRNSFGNGTIPDAVNRSSVIYNSSFLAGRLLFLNPA